MQALVPIILIGWSLGTVASGAAIHPHELPITLGKDGLATCTACHRIAPGQIPRQDTRSVRFDGRNYITGPIAMCVSCHGQEVIAHPVGLRPPFPVPADLPLDRDGKVSCLTCHYTHGNFKSDRPYGSTSLLDRLFNRERLSKSFLLRRENTRGELCRVCHNQQGLQRPIK
jgi:hypothetical protein